MKSRANTEKILTVVENSIFLNVQNPISVLMHKPRR